MLIKGFSGASLLHPWWRGPRCQMIRDQSEIKYESQADEWMRQTTIYFYGGYVQFSMKGTEKALCATCRNALRMTDDRGDVRTICHVSNPIWITRCVVRCSDYDEVGRMQLYEMKAVAWRLETDKKTRKIGFVPPSEWRKGLYSGKYDSNPHDSGEDDVE